MILRDRCNLASIFSWQAQRFTHMKKKNRKTHWYEAVSSALNSIFEGRLAELLRF